MEMRELRGDDLFILLNIVTKLDLKDDIVALFDDKSELMSPAEVNLIMKKHGKNKEALEAELKAELERRIEKRGMAIMAHISLKALSNVINIKEDLNGFLAELCGVKIKDIKELGLKDYTALVVAFFKKPELKDFFIQLASLMH